MSAQNVQIKICGLSTPETIMAAINSKADFIGFVFYEPSPRHLDIQTAKYLTASIPSNVKKVGLFVNPNDNYLQQILDEVALDFVQLHGTETPERVRDLKNQYKLPVIKSFPISAKQDLEAIKPYHGVADWFLFDAQAEKLPGGNGKAFDWTILENFKSETPWMLAGGLKPENVLQALKITSPNAVDVSSGVETSQSGKKDATKIHSFISAVKQA